MDSSVLDLVHRLPQSNIRSNVAALAELVEGRGHEIVNSTDQPLALAYDPEAKRHFICTEYNREGSSYRFAHLQLMTQGTCA